MIPEHKDRNILPKCKVSRVIPEILAVLSGAKRSPSNVGSIIIFVTAESSFPKVISLSQTLAVIFQYKKLYVMIY